VYFRYELCIICALKSLQLFGLHYYGIVDGHDLRWSTTMLEYCKSLDINDFLHGFCPYVVNRLHIKRHPMQSSEQSDPSFSVPSARTFVEFDIF
jgi:hypothetical protein